MQTKAIVAFTLATLGAAATATGFLVNGMQLKQYFSAPMVENPALAELRAIGCEPDLVSSNVPLPPDPEGLFRPTNLECAQGRPGQAVQMTFRLCGTRPLTRFTSTINTMSSGTGSSSTAVSYSLDGSTFTPPIVVRGAGRTRGTEQTPNEPRRFVRYTTSTTDPNETLSICSFTAAPLKYQLPS